MTITLSTLVKNAAGNAVVDAIDIGSLESTGYIEIRTGTKPSTPQIAATGTLLVTLSLSNPAFGSFSNAFATSNAISEETVISNGTAGWFRIYNRNRQAICDGTVTEVGDGGDITFDSINFLAGGSITISGLTASQA